MDPAVPIIYWNAFLHCFHMELGDLKPTDPSMFPMKHTPSGPCYTWTDTFQIFSVCQKREVCCSAVLQMKHPHFTQQKNLISTLKPQDLIKASQEETHKVHFSNPAVQALRDHLGTVRTRVKGTDESKHHVRSKIWKTNCKGTSIREVRISVRLAPTSTLLSTFKATPRSTSFISPPSL